jgi:hypothetical protein
MQPLHRVPKFYWWRTVFRTTPPKLCTVLPALWQTQYSTIVAFPRTIASGMYQTIANTPQPTTNHRPHTQTATAPTALSRPNHPPTSNRHHRAHWRGNTISTATICAARAIGDAGVDHIGRG